MAEYHGIYHDPARFAYSDEVEFDSGLQSLLQPGESLLWSGRPDPRAFLTPSDAYLVFFGAIWLTFSVFWEVSAVRGAGSYPFGIFGVPFILIGVWLLVGRPIQVRAIRKRTVYAITDRRAIVLTRRGWVDSPIRDQPVDVARSRSGRVSVSIGTPVPVTSTFPMQSGAGGSVMIPSRRRTRYVAPIVFSQVADGEALLAALNQARTPISDDWGG
jgi:hypothetical protein